MGHLLRPARTADSPRPSAIRARAARRRHAGLHPSVHRAPPPARGTRACIRVLTHALLHFFKKNAKLKHKPVCRPATSCTNRSGKPRNKCTLRVLQHNTCTAAPVDDNGHKALKYARYHSACDRA